MRCIAKGFFGALIVLVLVALIYPQYSDYRATAETSGWLNQLDKTKRSIEENIENNKTVIGSGINVQPPKFEEPSPPTYVKVMDNGNILVKGGREGQLIVLVPTLNASKVEWACVGGSSKATLGCRNAP